MLSGAAARTGKVRKKGEYINKIRRQLVAIKTATQIKRAKKEIIVITKQLVNSSM